MSGMLHNKIGLAGELRVMSELLLRGHNPAKSYLEEGADIVLANGLRIEVKSAHRCHCRHKGRDVKHYLFTLRGGGRKQPQNLTDCDFLIFWCIDDDCFFIIPKMKITGTCWRLKMILTKKKAIKISVELWTWLAETGSEYKGNWSGWEEYGGMKGDCALCEYDSRHGDGCDNCPYYQELGHCNSIGTPFYKWNSAGTKATRKKYAKKFLGQLKTL